MGFGGGIGSFSREVALDLAAWNGGGGRGIRLFGRWDVPGERWGSWTIQGAGAWPASLQGAVFSALIFRAAWRRRPHFILSTHVNFGPVARLLKRLRGIPYGIVAHGIDVDQRLSSSRIRALREADRVLAVSKWTQRKVAAFGVREDRLAILGNTVDEERFAPAGPVSPGEGRLRERYGFGEDDRIILTVGRLASSEVYKGYERVLRCLPRVQAGLGSVPVRYLLAGTGDDRARIAAEAERLGVSDRVTFAGFVAEEELADHYRLADVYAMPSTGEGFGIVFLEAMACGCPVLAGNRDGSVDALGGGELGELVDPCDEGAIAAGLLRLLRKEGPVWWFEPERLRGAMLARHGRVMFRKRLEEILGPLLKR